MIFFRDFYGIFSAWWVTAKSKMYSDYCGAAQKCGCNKLEFYVEMAKAFIEDKDGPGAEAKLAAYYHGIVNR